MNPETGESTRFVTVVPGVSATCLTAAAARRTLIWRQKMWRKLRSFFATAISVNPTCKTLFRNVKYRGCCTNRDLMKKKGLRPYS